MLELLLEYFKIDQEMYKDCNNERWNKLNNLKDTITKKIKEAIAGE